MCYPTHLWFLLSTAQIWNYSKSTREALTRDPGFPFVFPLNGQDYWRFFLGVTKRGIFCSSHVVTCCGKSRIKHKMYVYAAQRASLRVERD